MDQLDDDFRLSEDNNVIEKKRPAFLLVLCILTFVASGFGLISGLVSLAGVNDIESTLRNAQVNSDPFSEGIINSIDIAELQKLQTWANLMGIIASALCLAGALIMFKMRKIGFFPYVLGHAAGIYGAFLAVGIIKKMGEIMPVREMGDMMSMIGGATMVFTVIISIAFIIMYGVNLKHLK